MVVANRSNNRSTTAASSSAGCCARPINVTKTCRRLASHAPASGPRRLSPGWARAAIARSTPSRTASPRPALAASNAMLSPGWIAPGSAEARCRIAAYAVDQSR